MRYYDTFWLIFYTGDKEINAGDFKIEKAFKGDAVRAYVWDCVIIRQETEKPSRSKGLRAVRTSRIRF